MKYLLCGLDDKNYTQPYFSFFTSHYDAYTEATTRARNELFYSCNDGRIVISNRHTRIVTSILNHDWDVESFTVTEILEFDETNGDYLLVWHHAYDGVGFEIMFQGTKEECDAKRREGIKNLFKDPDIVEYNEDFDMDCDNVVDTVNEWQIFSIVKIE